MEAAQGKFINSVTNLFLQPFEKELGLSISQYRMLCTESQRKMEYYMSWLITSELGDSANIAKDTYYFEGSKQWFPRPILFGRDGYIYAAFDERGCTQRINPKDPQGDHQQILDHAPMHYILGEDGNFYYTENMTGNMATLFKLILN